MKSVERDIPAKTQPKLQIWLKLSALASILLIITVFFIGCMVLKKIELVQNQIIRFGAIYNSERIEQNITQELFDDKYACQDKLNTRQVSQLDNASLIIYHSPNIFQTIGYIHPVASLFGGIPNFTKCQNAYRKFTTVLNKYLIRSVQVSEILKINRSRLIELAHESSGYIPSQQLVHTQQWAITDQYKANVLQSLDDQTLLGLIFSRPKVYLRKDNPSIPMTIDRIEIDPLSNLIFTRDQQIITAGGLVMGNTQTTVRRFEKVVMKAVFKQLNIPLIGEATQNQFIQGGDFMAISQQLSLMQVGIRSNMEGARYLMNNNLIGTKTFGIVKDEKDRDQQRMHLDTIFNIIDSSTVLLFDFDHESIGKQTRRDIDVYQLGDDGTYIYQHTQEFEQFLRNQGYKIIKITPQEQEDFMINFLNIGKFEGNHVLLTSNQHFERKLIDHNVDVKVEYIEEFKQVNKMHGSFHCTTQVIR